MEHTNRKAKFVVKDNIYGLLQQYTCNEIINTLKYEAGIPDKPVFPPEMRPLLSNNNCGIYTEVKSLLENDNKSRFEEFDNFMKESIYHSSKNEPLGRTKQGTMTFDRNHLFGIKSCQEEPLYEIVFPLLKENRGLLIKQDDKKNIEDLVGYQQKCIPIIPLCDVTMENSMEWLYNPTYKCVINSVQGDYRNRSKTGVGQVLEPIKNRLYVPKDHAYGKPTNRSAENAAKCMYPKKIFGLDMDYLKSNRNIWKQTNWSNLLKDLSKLDQEKTGQLSKDVVFEFLVQQKIELDKTRFDDILKLFEIMNENGLIKYERFLDILDFTKELPNVDFGKDVDFGQWEAIGKDLKEFPPIPKIEPKPVIDEHVNNTSTMVYPDNYVRYNLEFDDYKKGRTKSEIFEIFNNIGYDNLDDIWKECVKIDNNPDDLVCINTFKNAVFKKYEMTC